MSRPQPGILAALPPQARYVSFQLKTDIGPAAVRQALERLRQRTRTQDLVVGLGRPLFAHLQVPVPAGLTDGPVIPGSRVALPVQAAALWCWLRGDDRGALLHAAHDLSAELAPAFESYHGIDAFLYQGGHDLTGYEDGTENPQGEAALAAACSDDGASYVAVQQWLHDFTAFNRLPPAAQDDVIGRRRSDNEELADAPASAHVKRTAQEDFEPEAFVLRRSMPWTAGSRAGLVFVAFGHSLQAFEQQLTRMSGAEDGIVDALFTISRPLSGSYFWCPPATDDGLDLTCLAV